MTEISPDLGDPLTNPHRPSGSGTIALHDADSNPQLRYVRPPTTGTLPQWDSVSTGP